MNEDTDGKSKAAGAGVALLHVVAGGFMAFLLFVFGLGIVLAAL